MSDETIKNLERRMADVEALASKTNDTVSRHTARLESIMAINEGTQKRLDGIHAKVNNASDTATSIKSNVALMEQKVESIDAAGKQLVKWAATLVIGLLSVGILWMVSTLVSADRGLSPNDIQEIRQLLQED